MNIKRLFVFLLTFLLCFSACACSGSETAHNDDASKIAAAKPSRFLVTVIDQDNNVVEGVILKLQKDSTVTARSNNKGIAMFPLVATSGYRLTVISCPKGYEYTGTKYIPIKKNQTELILKITKK